MRNANSKVCCQQCGSLNVQFAIWYSPNTGATGAMFGSWNAGDNTFCEDCDLEGQDNVNPPLVDSDADPVPFREARAKRIARDKREAKAQARERSKAKGAV